MRTTRCLLCRLAVLACAFTVVALGPKAAAADAATRTMLEEIEDARSETWRWQRLVRRPRTPASRLGERWLHPLLQLYALDSWRRQARRARSAAYNPPRLAAWLCIHGHEGAWTAETGNGYYGGLQMDRSFQLTYAPELVRAKGYAHRWLWIEQIWVAERAYGNGRGFRPWPNAARACGLT